MSKCRKVIKVKEEVRAKDVNSGIFSLHIELKAMGTDRLIEQKVTKVLQSRVSQSRQC